MAKVRTVNFSPDEFLIGVAGMKPLLGHVYWVTCALQMSSGRPINVNDPRLYSIIDARRPDIFAALDRLVTIGKLHRNGDEVWNERTQTEIESASKRIQNARENGPKGGRPSNKNKALDNQEGSAVGLGDEKLSQSQSRSSSRIKSEDHTQPLAKGSRLEPEWKPDQQDYLYGAQHALTGREVDAEAGEFREYFLSADARRPIKRDWRSAFQRWIRENASRRIAQRSRGRGPTSNGRGRGSVFAAVSEIMASSQANSHGVGGAAEDQEVQPGADEPEPDAICGYGADNGARRGVVIEGQWGNVRHPSDEDEIPHAAKG